MAAMVLAQGGKRCPCALLGDFDAGRIHAPCRGAFSGEGSVKKYRSAMRAAAHQATDVSPALLGTAAARAALSSEPVYDLKWLTQRPFREGMQGAARSP
jgi:hypothetical protein